MHNNNSISVVKKADINEIHVGNLNRESGNVSLEIPGANQFAEGIYFCKATNTAGTRQIPTFLDVSGEYIPMYHDCIK